MRTLLNTLYELLSFLTEDAYAHNMWSPVPGPVAQELRQGMQNLMRPLEQYLDTVDPMRAATPNQIQPPPRTV